MSASEGCAKSDFPSEVVGVVRYGKGEGGMSRTGGGMTWRQTKCESISDCVRETETPLIYSSKQSLFYIFLQQSQATKKAVKIFSPFFQSLLLLSPAFFTSHLLFYLSSFLLFLPQIIFSYFVSVIIIRKHPPFLRYSMQLCTLKQQLQVRRFMDYSYIMYLI